MACENETQRGVSGLTVRVNVDVSEAIVGLKAVQREAKRAAAALREVETLSSGNLKKYDRVVWEGEEYYVVVADNDDAVIAPVIGHHDAKAADMTKLIAIRNVAVTDR
ncbi:hypothetical protein [Paenibacillus naphthalenovorans]|uniref:hypothetical protein n=1 Tax=Paenibacillus naphthalenovorans TaxID=162209 RepID=UPI003D298CE4